MASNIARVALHWTTLNARGVQIRGSRTTVRASSSSATAFIDTIDARRRAALGAILRLDDERAFAQLTTSIEGRRVLVDTSLVTLANNLRALSAALPRECQPWVFELVVEAPSSLQRDDVKTDVQRVIDALGGEARFIELCIECPCAFAHLFTRLREEGAELEDCERALKEWARGEEGWHRVFVSRVASEWGYLQTLRRSETKTVRAGGEVYRNVKTGEAIEFRRGSVARRADADAPREPKT